jgi:hypothetical protein
MEADSDAQKKPKRQMKTPFQLDALEKTYALQTYPSEAIRQGLSVQLGLTDRQLQMWFCHRRLKDKKEGVVKKLVSSEPAEPESEPGSGSRSRSRSRSISGSGSGPGSDSSYDYDVPSPRSVMERRVIACIEAQLGEPLRDDGPVLGMVFDEPPPGAFGVPIVQPQSRDRSRDGKLVDPDSKPMRGSYRNFHDPGEPSLRLDPYARNPSHYYASPNRGYNGSQNAEPERYLSPLKDDYITNNEDGLQIGKKRKIDETRSGKEIQGNGKRSQREIEKHDLLRRKREELMKKEMEKQDRERRKEEERIMREQLRSKERDQRDAKRAIERREKFLQKESIKAEKQRQKDEQKRERDAIRQKAAIEKATARKFAKEYMELIEDERLELMKLAASSKGLSSLLSLDHDTLQNLDLFRGSLCAFPPKTVQLKKPFAFQPWIDSDDNVGNLLMVWRFCITFGDVLGLWPFTLDEFIQAFHDYDSRLLGEIHIALLRLIIKDIEDVARTPTGGLGTNQYTAANPEGGHPRIVEGAYLWGFDIINWKDHLNPLTWPEILRQFALSAGFGPKLKKEAIDQAPPTETTEGKGCEDIISMLRNGSAAENAVAVMQEKGFSLQRRSRHRLTPGTVKFAAYHVLALEGSKGLNVLELADKIQKSGLRDLSSSKTPDASISVALSRDPILFERIAPSTYCVRPAFRKDPENAESLLSAAREKIQRYVNGFLGGDSVDDVIVEEKDEIESECDVAEVDDVCTTPLTSNQKSDDLAAENGKIDGPCNDVALNLKHEIEDAGDPVNEFTNEIGVGDELVLEEGGTEIDESKSGESWVQGLTEGEYSDLCVEERLTALVSLIEIANEGNLVRAVLEDRLDAANALKKQMWAEAQLDKRRMKEETSKFPESSAAATQDGSQSPLTNYDAKSQAKEEQPSSTPGLENSHQNQITLQNGNNNNNNTVERARMQLKSFIGHCAEEMYVYRSLPLGQDRRRNRYWQFVACPSKNDPGSGRIFMESPEGFWRLIDSEQAFEALLKSLETRGTRESHLHTMLTKIETSFKENVKKSLLLSKDQSRSTIKSEVAELGSSPSSNIDTDSPKSAVCGSSNDSLEMSSSFKIELGQNRTERNNYLKRYQDLQMWMWKECVNPSTFCAVTYGEKGFKPILGICNSCFSCYVFEENICPKCHKAFGTFDSELNYLEYVIQYEESRRYNFDDATLLDISHPPRIRLLKALMTLLEVSIPADARQPSWVETRRKPWGLKLQSALSTGDLLQILTQLEGFIKRDSVSSSFETTEELLRSSRASRKESSSGFVPQLPWIPQTTAAIALRLLELDSSISYALLHKDEPHNQADDFIKPQSRYAYVKSIQKGQQSELNPDLNMKEESRLRGLKGRGGSGGARQRGQAQKSARGSALKSGRRNMKDNSTSSHLGTLRGPGTNKQRKIGNTIATVDPLEDRMDYGVGPSVGLLPPGGEEWGVDEEEEVGKMQMEDESESDDDDDVPPSTTSPTAWNRSNRSATWDLMESSDDDMEGSDDENGYDDDGNLNGGDHRLQQQNIGGQNMNQGLHGNYGLDQNMDEDEGSESADSGDYSD